MSWNPARLTVANMLTPLFLIFMLLFLFVIAQSAVAQTFTVLHNFTDGQDGSVPAVGLVMDAAGNFYGTTWNGGQRNCGGGLYGCGAVFKLAHKASGWILTPLYDFAGGSDGSQPYSRVLFGLDGRLYGTTSGGQDGFGTVFNLTPLARTPRTSLDPWVETVLHRFSGGGDGSVPHGDPVFDASGNLYGTTYEGGAYGQGAVYKLTRSHGTWTQSVIYSFTGGTDGKWPLGGLIFDQSGNLYGTTSKGGQYGYGALYALNPSTTGWTENVLHSFAGGNDGTGPVGGLVSDRVGDLYGTTQGDEYITCGTVYKLTPSPSSWTLTNLHVFDCGVDGENPDNGLVFDATGNLYGAAIYGGLSGCFGGCGVVFKLAPGSDGIWSYSLLHEFNGGDGALPVGSVIVDANGNLYGTAAYGGTYECSGRGCGVVWEITP